MGFNVLQNASAMRLQGMPCASAGVLAVMVPVFARIEI
jgi:hypothetical protein